MDSQLKENTSHSLTWTQKSNFPFSEVHLPSPGAFGKTESKFQISSFTEFDPLKSVIVGFIDETAYITEDIMVSRNPQAKIQAGKIPSEIVEEAQKYQDTLAKKLDELGVEVLRVGQVDWSQPYDVQGFKTYGFCVFSPRDIPFLYHDSMYEFPTFNITRIQEYKAFEWIEKKLHENSSKIFSSWSPMTKGYRYFPWREEMKEMHLKED